MNTAKPGTPSKCLKNLFFVTTIATLFAWIPVTNAQTRAEVLKMHRASDYINNRQYREAERILNQIDTSDFSKNYKQYFRLLGAAIDLSNNRFGIARNTAETIMRNASESQIYNMARELLNAVEKSEENYNREQKEMEEEARDREFYRQLESLNKDLDRQWSNKDWDGYSRTSEQIFRLYSGVRPIPSSFLINYAMALFQMGNYAAAKQALVNYSRSTESKSADGLKMARDLEADISEYLK